MDHGDERGRVGDSRKSATGRGHRGFLIAPVMT